MLFLTRLRSSCVPVHLNGTPETANETLMFAVLLHRANWDEDKFSKQMMQDIKSRGICKPCTSIHCSFTPSRKVKSQGQVLALGAFQGHSGGRMASLKTPRADNIILFTWQHCHLQCIKQLTPHYVVIHFTRWHKLVAQHSETLSST